MARLDAEAGCGRKRLLSALLSSPLEGMRSDSFH
jgi:hypothetical protein